MKRNIGVAAALGLLATAALSATATATCTTPSLISFNGQDVFAFETNYNNATYTSAPGSVLTIMGKVVCFGPPLDYLNSAPYTSNEYTFVIQGLVSAGTVHTTPLSGLDVWDTDYNVSGATWTLYEDATPDAPGAATIGSPASALPFFVDGTVLLNGTVDNNFHTQITRTVKISPPSTTWSGSFNSLYHAIGGTVFNKIGNGQANLNGLWCSLGTGTSQCTLPAGYSAHPSGKFDAPGTTATNGPTWGRIKLLYR